MRTDARTAATVGRALLGASAVFGVLLLLALGVGPKTGAYRTLTVLTGSMDPAIASGSVVIVTPQSPSDIRVGQVLTYEAPIADRRIVTHRVTEVRDPGMHPVIVTKGDANSHPDPWAARIEDPQVWRVRATVPVLGHLIHALRSPFTRALSVWILPFVLAGLWIRDLWSPFAPEGFTDDEALGHT